MMPEKNYKKWHKIKETINKKTKGDVVFFHEREIWYCHLGANVGFEQDGKGQDFFRPILIFKKFNNSSFLGIPLTKSKILNKKNDRFYYAFSFIPNITSLAILSQIRMIDVKRLARQIGTITEQDFKSLTKKFKDLLP